MKQSFSKEEEHVMRRFDRLCQMALKGEAINYYKHMDYRRNNEVMLSELSENEMNNLYMCDEYPSEDYFFEVLGYKITVQDMWLAEALKSLTQRKRDGEVITIGK